MPHAFCLFVFQIVSVSTQYVPIWILFGDPHIMNNPLSYEHWTGLSQDALFLNQFTMYTDLQILNKEIETIKSSSSKI